MNEMSLRLLPEIGHMMRDILHEYHNHVSLPYHPVAMYIKPAPHMHYMSPAFILTPIHDRHEHQFVVYLDRSPMSWIFMVVPF